MKRFAAAVIMFLFVIGLSVTEMLYLNDLSDKLYDSIRLAEEYYAEDISSAKNAAGAAIELWEDNKPWLSVFINHDKLDKVSEGFSLLQLRCDGDRHEFDIAVSDLNFLIKDMLKEESFSVYSFL